MTDEFSSDVYSLVRDTEEHQYWFLILDKPELQRIEPPSPKYGNCTLDLVNSSW